MKVGLPVSRSACPGVQEVVAGVTQQFVNQVRDQLAAMRTAELSLQKVRKSRAADASADGAKPLSDVDKVNAQLFLDAQVCPWSDEKAAFLVVPWPCGPWSCRSRSEQ